MTAIDITDADYWTLANKIYDDEKLRPKAKFYAQNSLNNPDQDIVDHHNWKTVTSINDKNSDLQAAMVVPSDEYDAVVKHHQQPSQAIFVSRGTSSLRDWQTNATELATGATPKTLEKITQEQKKEPIYTATNNAHIDPAGTLQQVAEENQFVQYDKFVSKSLKKYKPKEYSFTGHSLGGALATYEAVQYNAPATTFAGANSYRLFNEKQKQDIKAGKYDNKITNYRHYGDIVPNVPFDNKDCDQTVGKQIFVQSGVPNRSFKALTYLINPIATIGGLIINEFNQHSTKNWTRKTFNSNGSIKKEPSKYSSFNPETLGDFEKEIAKIYAGKGSNGGEKIKISPDDIIALASRLISIVEDTIATAVTQINSNAEKDFIDNYDYGKKVARQLAPDLSENEIENCLTDGGITYKKMVTNPTEGITSKTKKMTSGGDFLTEIANATQNASSQFTNTDNHIY